MHRLPLYSTGHGPLHVRCQKSEIPYKGGEEKGAKKKKVEKEREERGGGGERKEEGN